MYKKKILSLAMAAAMAASLTIPAFAVVNTSLTTTSTIKVDTQGQGTTPVILEADATTLDVVVPTSLPVAMDALGQVYTASDAKIINNSFGAVKVSDMTLAGANTWATMEWNKGILTAKVGDKKFGMEVNSHYTNATADTIETTPGTNFDGSKFTVMAGATAATATPGANEAGITYDAEIPAQSAAITAETIANVVFTVVWDAAT